MKTQYTWVNQDQDDATIPDFNGSSSTNIPMIGDEIFCLNAYKMNLKKKNDIILMQKNVPSSL